MSLNLKIHQTALKYALKATDKNQGILLDCSHTKSEAVLEFIDLSFKKTTCKKHSLLFLKQKKPPNLEAV